jgi:hypothetical protein
MIYLKWSSTGGIRERLFFSPVIANVALLLLEYPTPKDNSNRICRLMGLFGDQLVMNAFIFCLHPLMKAFPMLSWRMPLIMGTIYKFTQTKGGINENI